MNIYDIIKKAGSRIIRNVIPGGDIAVDMINSMLPAGSKVGATVTGYDLQTLMNDPTMPDHVAEGLISLKFEEHETLRTMINADAVQKHTTRPYIAKGAFHVIATVTMIVALMWAWAVASKNDEMVTAVMDGWPFIAAICGPLVTLLWAYFGILKNEQRDRLSGGQPNGLIGTLVSALKK